MNNRIIASAIIALGITLTPNGVSAVPGDSIVVVKGQVSDYYIPVVTQHSITGIVTDENNRPLQGATVMFPASPVHCNTDVNGRFTLTGVDSDSLLYVFYPGKELENHPVGADYTNVAVKLRPEQQRYIAPRAKAQATQWYNAATYTPQTFCNPINISYNFEPYNNNVLAEGSFRSSADPMALMYGDECFLFSTNQDGFHYSKNLTDWEFAPASFKRKPTNDDQCAPAAYVVADTLFYTGSTYEGLPVWYTTSPKSGKFRRGVERNTLPSWDPCLFLDDDGKLYLYYGSSNEYPLKAVQVSRMDFSPISKIYDALALHPKDHGWERFGMNNDDEVTLAPFTEGAYMTKHNGKYYLQYGAPGTEFKVYADGVYVSDNPLGPFVYQKHNPMSYKPGGYVQGSGHGGTFADNAGNYWHVSTCMLSLKYKFERRIGLYPVGFDADGIMYSSAAFGDYPNWNVEKNIANPADRFTDWMLLSYGKPATVSSYDNAERYPASAITDESLRSYWAAASGNPGEWVIVDLESPKTVQAIQVNYYDHKAQQFDRANDIYHQYRIFASENGEDWTLVIDKSDNDRDVPHDYVELQSPLRARYIKLENLHMPTGNFALSGLRVFGSAEGVAPAAVKKLKVDRDKDDPRNAMISWTPVDGAYGYNIYYGIAPDKLYNAITVYGDTQYDMRGLDRATEYYFSIEALGESGRSPLSKVVNK
jgi:beta-xylosidase